MTESTNRIQADMRQGYQPYRSRYFPSHWCQRLGEKGVEQAETDGGGLIEARLQPVAQRHQLIDPGDDVALLFSLHRQGVQ